MGKYRYANAMLAALALTTFGEADAAINLALGKPVSLHGEFGTGGGTWGAPALADPASLTDGVFRPEQEQWNSASIWWDASQPNAAANSIVIDLQGPVQIDAFKVQADDNDTYRIEYFDGSDWLVAWDIPAPGPFGLVTSETTLASPIVASALRFTAIGGDDYYAVAEIQVLSSVPVPAGLWLLASGLVSLVVAARRRA